MKEQLYVGAARLIAGWVAAVVLACSPCAGNDVLRFRLTSGWAEDWVYDYWTFSRNGCTVQAGDFIEYDVYLDCGAAGVGGIDIRNTDGSCWRGFADWQDQNGVSGHPTADLSPYARGRWFHRRLAVPPAAVGKTIAQWDVAVDGVYGPHSVLSAQYDNIVVTRGGSAVLAAYQDGAPDFSARNFSRGVWSDDLLHGPSRRSGIQIGAYLFYWYDAPYNNASASQMPYHPYGLAGDPWSGYGGGYYSMLNQYWWEGEFQDMERAGLDVAALICWGDANSVSSYMVPALDRSGCNIKIAMFDDTTSECCEWNYHNGRGYAPSPQMPLSDQNNWTYFYDRKIRPFFQAIPQRYWATHNGRSLEQGGRPIIITYTSAWFSDVASHGTALWQWIKNRFASDFRDVNDQPIVPWLIHETSWFNSGAGGAADGRYAWGAATGRGSTYSVGGFDTSQIGPGYDDRLIRYPGLFVARNDAGQLVGAFNWERPWESDLAMVETWNELWEGTGVGRCKDYPALSGGYLPETYYMDTIRALIAGSVGLPDLDATFLRTWETPANAKRGSVITVNVRNDGLLPWTPGEYSLGGRLLDASTGAVISGTERSLAAVPTEVLSGDERSISFSVPTDWPVAPTSNYILQLDMMRGSDWFAASGDRPVAKAINIKPSDTNPPSSVSSFAAAAGEKRVTLSWRNPSTSDYASTVVRMSTTWYPLYPYSPDPVCHRYAKRNTNDSYVVYQLTPGVTYYFSAFAQDTSGNWSSVARATAVPLPDATPPGPPQAFTASAYGTEHLVLQWTNPSDVDFKGVMIRRKASGHPTSPTDGELVCNVPGLPGQRQSFFHLNLTPGVPCYYSAFAYDAEPNYSPAATAFGVPLASSCSGVKQLREGAPVKLNGKVVTAVFGFDNCVYIEEPDRSSGIRVVTTSAPFAIGDVVNVAGTVTTRRPDGSTPSERQITSAVVSVVGSGATIEPVTMNCLAVGGAAIPPYVPGVDGGLGLNNIGLLARIAGKVTGKYAPYIWVDDGSGILDATGRIGVMVKCPSSSVPVSVGAAVVVTGIVEGSIPVGWTSNRRCLRMRDWNDLVELCP